MLLRCLQAGSVITFINSQLGTCPANVTALSCASLDGDGDTTTAVATPIQTSPETPETMTTHATPNVAFGGVSLTPADYAKCASLSATTCQKCTGDNAICVWCDSTKNCNATANGYYGPSDSENSLCCACDSVF
jgi:hypothetical protein